MAVTTADRWRALRLASLGGGLEFYDFVIYAVFASTLGEIFFPGEDARVQLLAAFGVFAVGYLARPLGGLVFSHFGDRLGRRAMLRITIGGMAGATILMALMPTYAQIGLAAPVLFVGLRILQGLCLGGEIPGALVLVSETMPRARGFACGVLFLMINIGLLLAHAVQYAIVSLLPAGDVSAYGWRIGFLVGGAIAFAGFVLRTRLVESPAFVEMQSATHRLPIARLFAEHTRAVVLGFLVTGLGAAAVSMLYLYMNSYLITFLHYDHDLVAMAGLVGIVIFSLPMPLAGWIADRLGPRWPAVATAAALAAAAVPTYLWLAHDQGSVVAALAAISVLAAFAWAIALAVLAVLFPTDVRYSGIAFAYNMGFAVVGGLTPLAATWLIGATGSVIAPGMILAVFAGLGAIAALLARPTAEVAEADGLGG